MSLEEHLREQEEQARHLQERLNNLAAEYSKRMIALGDRPLPVLNTTGHFTSYVIKGYWDTPDEVVITHQCRPTGIEAWCFGVDSRELGFSSRDRVLAVSVGTPAKLLVTEIKVTLGRDYAAEGYEGAALVYHQERSAKTWQDLRERDQHNTLLRWSEQAHLNGLDSVILPIEHAMLHRINELRKR